MRVLTLCSALLKLLHVCCVDIDTVLIIACKHVQLGHQNTCLLKRRDVVAQAIMSLIKVPDLSSVTAQPLLAFALGAAVVLVLYAAGAGTAAQPKVPAVQGAGADGNPATMHRQSGGGSRAGAARAVAAAAGSAAVAEKRNTSWQRAGALGTIGAAGAGANRRRLARDTAREQQPDTVASNAAGDTKRAQAAAEREAADRAALSDAKASEQARSMAWQQSLDPGFHDSGVSQTLSATPRGAWGDANAAQALAGQQTHAGPPGSATAREAGDVHDRTPTWPQSALAASAASRQAGEQMSLGAGSNKLVGSDKNAVGDAQRQAKAREVQMEKSAAGWSSGAAHQLAGADAAGQGQQADARLAFRSAEKASNELPWWRRLRGKPAANSSMSAGAAPASASVGAGSISAPDPTPSAPEPDASKAGPSHAPRPSKPAAVRKPASKLDRTLGSLIAGALLPIAPLLNRPMKNDPTSNVAVPSARPAVDPLAAIPKVQRNVTRPGWDPLANLSNIQPRSIAAAMKSASGSATDTTSKPVPTRDSVGVPAWDPLANVHLANAPTGHVGWDPLPSLLAAQAPTQSDPWDPWPQVRGIQVPSGRDEWDPLPVVLQADVPSGQAVLDPWKALIHTAQRMRMPKVCRLRYTASCFSLSHNVYIIAVCPAS